jgi:hypothetical protein
VEIEDDDDKTSNRGNHNHNHTNQEDWAGEEVANACDKLRKVIEIRLVFPFGFLSPSNTPKGR